MVAPLSLTADDMEFHSATPILRVADLQASIDHYVDVLGFGLQWRHRQLIACVARGPRFGSESKPGEPFGDWLDMHGNSWKASQRD
jgi:hypothetical protein